MKILIITSSLDDGGVARIVSEMTLLLPQDWQFDILLVHSEDIRYKYNGRIIGLGIKEPKSRTNLLYAMKVFVKRFKVLKELKDNNNYDVCISFMDSSNVCNILTGNKKCKTLAVVENYMSQQAKYDWKYRYIVNPMIKLFYNKADKVVACSNESCDDLAQNYGIKRDKLQRIYCSIDTKSIEDVCNTSEIPSEDKDWFSKDRTILTAGRLCMQKGQWHLVRAFDKVVKTVPDAKLVIFGDGELKDYLNKLISDYGLEKNVIIHKYTNILPAYISNSAAFVMPSLFEGFPTAMLMAFSCGTACIASDFVSGAREQLAPECKDPIKGFYCGGYGILTMPLDEKKLSAEEPLLEEENSLADALISVLTDEKTRSKYSDLAKKRSLDFDSIKIYDEWKEVISEVCAIQNT